MWHFSFVTSRFWQIWSPNKSLGFSFRSKFWSHHSVIASTNHIGNVGLFWFDWFGLSKIYFSWWLFGRKACALSALRHIVAWGCKKNHWEPCLRGRKNNPNTFSEVWKRFHQNTPQSTSVSEVAKRIGGNAVKEVAKRIRILSLRYCLWGCKDNQLEYCHQDTTFLRFKNMGILFPMFCLRGSEIRNTLPKVLSLSAPLPISQTEGYSILSENSLCGPPTSRQHQSSWSSSPLNKPGSANPAKKIPVWKSSHLERLLQTRHRQKALKLLKKFFFKLFF